DTEAALFDTGQGVGQLAMHLCREAIELVGAVQPDACNAALFMKLDILVIQVRFLIRGSGVPARLHDAEAIRNEGRVRECGVGGRVCTRPVEVAESCSLIEEYGTCQIER